MAKKDKEKSKVELVLPKVQEGQTEAPVQQNAVAIVGAGAALGNMFMPDLFKDIDFNGLNAAIDKMGAASGELNEDDKDFARSIISEWNQSVVSRLNEKHGEMNYFISFFNPDNESLQLGHLGIHEFGQDLADKTSTQTEFKAVLAARDELRNHEASRPDSPIKSETDTAEDTIRKQKTYEADLAIYRAKHERLIRQVAVATGKWKRALNQDSSVKDLMSNARKFTRESGKMRDTAKEKAQLAKLNISISSGTARESLKELLEFTQTI